MAKSGLKKENRFATTRWSMVAAAGRVDSPEAQSALGELCARYWTPLYAFLRHRGYGREEARDMTQAFIVELLEKKALRAADRNRGRFRSFLLGCLKNFLSHEKDKKQAKKRGGGVVTFAMEVEEGEQRYEPVARERSPEAAYERVWMSMVLKQVMDRLREPFDQEGRGHYFARLMPGIYGAEHVDSEMVAKELGMTAVAVRQAASRLRKRYRELLVEEIGQTVADAGEVEEEIRELFAIASG